MTEAAREADVPGGRAQDATLRRFDADDAPWPWRPWIMAAICAVAALIFYWLIHVPASEWINGKQVAAPRQWGLVDGNLTPFRQALAVFVGVGTIAFVLTVELRRWWWSLLFALGWGIVTASAGYFTALYNRSGDLFDFPFFAGIFAVLLAAPLFQAARDLGRRAFPYARTHNHIWTDAVIGAAALAFTGISFLLVNLLAELFSLVGMTFLRDLLNEEWFGWLVAGTAFGTAIGVMRERDGLVATMQRLVMVILAVLAPVLAAGLILFLLSLPFTGLQKLWDTTQATTPILLSCAAGAFILANAVIGNGREERSPNRVLQYAALALALCILPLSLIAAISMGLRIEQYGWTPARIWGMLVVFVAVAYGLSYLWAVMKGRKEWDDLARLWNLRGAIALVGIAVFLALPILDFGAISARDQMARLARGIIKPHQFDYAAMAFDFGPKGRALLSGMTASPDLDIASKAQRALAAKNKWDADVPQVRNELDEMPLTGRIGFEDNGVAEIVRRELTDEIRNAGFCAYGPCTVRRIARPDREGDIWIVFGQQKDEGDRRVALMHKQMQGERPVWSNEILYTGGGSKEPWTNHEIETGPAAKVELRPVPRYQVIVDGKPTTAFVDGDDPLGRFPKPPPPVPASAR